VEDFSLTAVYFRLGVTHFLLVPYRKAHTKATQEWLDRLAQENVYVLVCLTYADKLYAELMDKGGRHPNPAAAKSELMKQAEVSYAYLFLIIYYCQYCTR